MICQSGLPFLLGNPGRGLGGEKMFPQKKEACRKAGAFHHFLDPPPLPGNITLAFAVLRNGRVYCVQPHIISSSVNIAPAQEWPASVRRPDFFLRDAVAEALSRQPRWKGLAAMVSGSEWRSVCRALAPKDQCGLIYSVMEASCSFISYYEKTGSAEGWGQEACKWGPLMSFFGLCDIKGRVAPSPETTRAHRILGRLSRWPRRLLRPPRASFIALAASFRENAV